jgi:BioD-like phosphotransacetylase family protein
MITFTADTWIQRIVDAQQEPASRPPTLIFVAGDRSQVGKSSSCLGLLGTLHEKLGYKSEDLAYIKPVTQCEGTQLITRYCEEKGIAHVGIGPVVFFSGFTRSFLQGEQGTTDDLLRTIQKSVENLSREKKIVIVDGVGYPAVGR